LLLLPFFDQGGNLEGKYSDNQLVIGQKNIFFYFYLCAVVVLGVPRPKAQHGALGRVACCGVLVLALRASHRASRAPTPAHAKAQHGAPRPLFAVVFWAQKT
jgi:hypothetical protein